MKHTFTINALDAIEGITAVLPHASKDGTVPAISSLLFRADGNHLEIVATDRYTLGCYRAPGQGDKDFYCLLTVAQVKDLLAIIKMGQREWKVIPTDVVFTLDEINNDGGKSGYHFQVEAGQKTHVLKGATLDATFPPYASLVPTVDEGRDGSVQAVFNTMFMAKFAKAGDIMSCWQQSPTKPMLVRVGDNFFGIIMPVRLADARSAVSAAPEEMQRAVGVKPTTPVVVAPVEKPPVAPEVKPAATVPVKPSRMVDVPLPEMPVAPAVAKPPRKVVDRPVPAKDMPKRSTARKAPAKKVAPRKVA